MKEQFLSHIEKTGLFSPKDKILLAVSGGLDSMVMLNLFLEEGFSIGVAHCNFQLRGDESDGDARLIEAVCKQKNVQCFAKRFDTKRYAEENNLSIQLAARELRYGWFREIMDVEKFTRLATAHHANDNLETFILNFARGTGLKTIPELNETLVRPLLHFRRVDLESYAKENALVWREDSSNATDDYPRNFVRHQIVPRLQELNPNLEGGFERTISHLASSRELAEKYIQQVIDHSVTHQKDRIVIKKSFCNKILHCVPLLWELIKAYGFNFDQSKEIVDALTGEPGKIFLSPGYRLVVDRHDLIITRHEKFWEAVTIHEHQSEALLGAWMLSIDHPSRIEVENDSFVAWLDKDLVKFPLTWRTWDHGDYFYPLGMEHKKKLSDFMIDRKMSVADKDYVTVLESGGHIIWVVGCRIDNRFKITTKSKAALKITLDQYFT